MLPKLILWPRPGPREGVPQPPGNFYDSPASRNGPWGKLIYGPGLPGPPGLPGAVGWLWPIEEKAQLEEEAHGEEEDDHDSKMIECLSASAEWRSKGLEVMAHELKPNQCITVDSMAASLLLLSGPGGRADRSLREDGQPCMSEELKQTALRLLKLAMTEGILDEKKWSTHRAMIQIDLRRCIKLFQKRRSQSRSFSPQPPSRGSSTAGLVDAPSNHLELELEEVMGEEVDFSADPGVVALHAVRARSRSPRPVAMKAGVPVGLATLQDIRDHEQSSLKSSL